MGWGVSRERVVKYVRVLTTARAQQIKTHLSKASFSKDFDKLKVVDLHPLSLHRLWQFNGNRALRGYDGGGNGRRFRRGIVDVVVRATASYSAANLCKY